MITGSPGGFSAPGVGAFAPALFSSRPFASGHLLLERRAASAARCKQARKDRAMNTGDDNEPAKKNAVDRSPYATISPRNKAHHSKRLKQGFTPQKTMQRIHRTKKQLKNLERCEFHD